MIIISVIPSISPQRYPIHRYYLTRSAARRGHNVINTSENGNRPTTMINSNVVSNDFLQKTNNGQHNDRSISSVIRLPQQVPAYSRPASFEQYIIQARDFTSSKNNSKKLPSHVISVSCIQLKSCFRIAQDKFQRV